MSGNKDYLQPPRPGYINPNYVVPLSPPIRPPFATYHSASTLPATPQTPYPPAPGKSQPFVPRSSGLTPYLNFPTRLLLTTLSPALLPLILTIAHLIQNRASTASLATTLRSSLLSACSGLATGAASIQTLPRYLAMQTNDEVIRATQASILLIGAALIDCVTIIETVVTFIADTYRSMLLCTIELAVRGTLDILISAVHTISSSVTSSLNSVRTDIQEDISSANLLIQSAVSKINSVTSLVDVTLSVPNFTIPSLTFLENVTIPTTFESSLISLNNSIPSLSELKEKMDDLISIPFESLKTDINSTRLEMATSFNSSILPVPSLSSLASSNANDLKNQLCSNLDSSLIDETASALHKLSDVAIGLMFLLLFLVWGALCLWEWRRWRAMKNTVEAVEAEWQRGGPADAWRMVAIVEHPILERYGSVVLERVVPQERLRRNLRWYLAYLGHPTCLALLCVASLGFLSLQCQMVALDAIKQHAAASANASVTASTNSLVAQINAVALNSSQRYATEFNNAIATYQTRINDELFGSWLNTTAVVLNDTLVTFYDEVESLLNASFGGTILYDPINTFIYCILGSKITTLEQGLTWISEHAQLTLPTLPADVLVLSNSTMNELASPVAAAAVGSGDDTSEDEGFVDKLIDSFEKALRAERNFYAILLGVWLGFALIGLFVVLWHSGGRERWIALRNGGKKGGDNGAGTSKFWKWGKEPTPIYDEYAEKEFRGTSPTSIPRIVEPGTNPSVTPGTSASFFNYKNESTARAFAGRMTTFGSIASLAAPGQAFLKLGLGRKTPDADRLVEKGVSLENYNLHHDAATNSAELERAETPPPLWVNRFYGAIDGVKSLFPTRGQKLGADLKRNGSSRTDRSFGASQVPSAITPRGDWPTGNEIGGKSEPSWTIVTPPSMGRSDDGRYPITNHSNPSNHSYASSGSSLTRELAGTGSSLSYPRPMSRAQTMHEGASISRSNPFADAPAGPSKHDPIDYLQDQDRHEDLPEAEYQYDLDPDSHAHSRSWVERQGREGTFSPTSRASSGSYAHSEAQVESASRVQTGTAALAAILANMQERKKREDPFRTPFDDEHER